MKKYVCDVCGYVYDPEVGDPDNGIEPGTAFEDLRMIGCARYAVSAKTSSARSNPARKYKGLPQYDKGMPCTL